MSDSLDLAAALLRRPDFEGLRLKPYLCPAGHWTIGIGNCCLADGNPVTADTPPITEAEAISLMRSTLSVVRGKLRSFVHVPVTPQQEAALLSWQYNVGSGAACASTLISLLNHRFYTAAADQFRVWNKATVNGKLIELKGLTHRRAIERDVFLGDLIIGA